jgi:hypothetical protein
MDKIKMIEEIIFLPNKFQEGNDTIYTLLKNTGYFDNKNEVNESDIYEALLKNQECINQWIIFSEDNRSSPSWYIIEYKKGKYTVGFYPEDKNLKPVDYKDKALACAKFVKRKIDDISSDQLRCNIY